MPWHTYVAYFFADACGHLHVPSFTRNAFHLTRQSVCAEHPMNTQPVKRPLRRVAYFNEPFSEN